MKSYLIVYIFVLIGIVPIYSQIQSETRYYRTYEDFIRKTDISLSKLLGESFYRARYTHKRVQQLDHILPDGSLDYFMMYFYDERGNLLVKDRFSSDSLLLFRTSYQPDDVQRLMLQKIQGREWMSSQKDYYTVCHFDSAGNPIEYAVKAASGEDVGRLEYRYNDRNDMIMEIWIRARDKKVIEVSDFNFDYENAVQHITQYDSSGLEVSRISVKIPDAVSDSTQP